MSVLVTTLRRALDRADAHLRAGRVPAARRAYEDLLERAQGRTDRRMELTARAMLARCLLEVRQVDAARDQLDAAARLLDLADADAVARYRAAAARVALEEGPVARAREACFGYLRWAEARGHPDVLDAALLLARASEPDERVGWLQRGIDGALRFGGHPALGRAYADLGAALDQLGRAEEALDAFQHALDRRRQELARGAGSMRAVVGAAWAVGAVACRLEDWPLARDLLEEARALADRADDCGDLLSLVLMDLATAYEAAGDVIEARRLLVRALQAGREHDLPAVWPQRWQALVGRARALELTT